MKYLVEFNNGFEGDENNLSKGFNTLDEAKIYAKEKCEVYYNISKGEYLFDEEIGAYQGGGKTILSNCNDKSVMWFYAWTADFCEVENL